MSIITKVLAVLVALEFLYIMYLETMATTSEKTAKVFGMDQEELSRKPVNTLFKKGIHEGVNISVEDNVVYIDLFVILKRDVNVREVSHAIQNQVARAISEMVGMEIGRINVHVEDIDFSTN